LLFIEKQAPPSDCQATLKFTTDFQDHLRFARSLQIATQILGGSDIAKTVVTF
jgi:hypothetical protein